MYEIYCSLAYVYVWNCIHMDIFVNQRPEMEQMEMAAKWTELGIDSPGKIILEMLITVVIIYSLKVK